MASVSDRSVCWDNTAGYKDDDDVNAVAAVVVVVVVVAGVVGAAAATAAATAAADDEEVEEDAVEDDEDNIDDDDDAAGTGDVTTAAEDDEANANTGTDAAFTATADTTGERLDGPPLAVTSETDADAATDAAPGTRANGARRVSSISMSWETGDDVSNTATPASCEETSFKGCWEHGGGTTIKHTSNTHHDGMHSHAQHTYTYCAGITL